MKKFLLISLVFVSSIFPYGKSSFANFEDIPTDYLYVDAINYVQTKNIVSGYPDGTFKPDDQINRAEFTKILIGSIKYNPEGSNCFTDVTNEWFASYVCYAKENGIINGYADNSFKPDKLINYAEVSKIAVQTFDIPTDSNFKNEDSEWYQQFTSALENYVTLPDSITDPSKSITRGEMAEIVYKVRSKFIQNHEFYNSYYREKTNTEALLNGEFLDATPDEILNTAYYFTHGDDSYHALDLLNNYLSEDLFENNEAKLELYYLLLSQANYQTRNYEFAKKYANLVIDITVPSSYHGYKARQLLYATKLELGENVFDEIDVLTSNFPTKWDTSMIKISILHNTDIIYNDNLDRNEFFYGYIPANHIVYEPYYLTLLAEIYRGQNRIDDAEKLLIESIQDNPGYLQAYLEYGRLYFDQGNYEESINYFKKAIDIDPYYYKSFNLIGYTISEAVQAGKMDESKYDIALDSLNEAIKLAPQYARPYNTIGYIYADKGDHEKAIEYFLQAIEYEKYPKPYNNAADSYEALGNTEKAEEYREKAKNLSSPTIWPEILTF